MRKRLTTSLAIASTALVAATGLFAVLAGCGSGSGSGGSDSDYGAGSTTQAGSTQATTGGSSTTGATTTQPSRAETAAIKRIVVRGGKPVGGVARLEYENGERVRFTVDSDVADEVHVHGFDIMKDVPANGSVRFDFPASIEGVFEVELEGAHLEIAQLRISP